MSRSRVRWSACLAVAWLAWFAGNAQARCVPAATGGTVCTASATLPGAARHRPGPGTGPEGSWPDTVLPNTPTPEFGWVQYNPSTCTGNSGSWAVTTPPTRGSTSTQIEMLPLGNGDCVGVMFPFNFIVYTWTDTDDKNLTDVFDATWSAPGFSSAEHFDITKAHVEVLSFDVTTGNVQLNLVGPVDVSGTLEATFSGSPVSATPQTSSGSFGPGAATMLINRPALRKSAYDKLTVKWMVATPPLSGKLKPNKPWDVLGEVRYSQYNVPYESTCGGGSTDVFIVNSLSSCTFTPATMSTRFGRQVNLNGTGVSVSNGTLKAGAATSLATSCAGRFPPGATVDNSYLQVADVRGACNVPLVAESSLATARTAGIACNRNLQLVNSGNANYAVKVRHDTCPACRGDFAGTEGHIDHFSGQQACSSNAVGDLGNFWSVQSN